MGKSLNTKTVLLFLFIFFWFLGIPAISFSAWMTEAVDAPKSFYSSKDRALAIDTANRPHIIYGGDHLYHTYFDGNTWQYEVVDSAPGVEGSSSIAVDSNNKVHITYADSDNGYLKYATNATGSWVTSTIDSTGYSVGYTSIAVDSNDKVHISYSDRTNYDLKYATNASGSWVTSTIDNEGYVGQFNSIAVDSSNRVHISYEVFSNRDLKYAYGYVDAGSVSPTSHDFGSVNIEKSSAPQTFTISNTSTATLHFSGISLSDTANYSLDVNGGTNPCGSTTPTITPDSSCTVTVTFSPTSEGTKNANLTISTDEPDETNVTVPLTGNGIHFLLSPNGGEIIPSGSTYLIQWGAPSQAVKFDLLYSMDNGTTWNTIASKATGTSYDWHVPIPSNNKKRCLVKVIGYNASEVKVGEDTSDSKFTIEVVKVTFPDGGETLKSRNLHTITWRINETIRPVASVKLYYTINGGTTWKLKTTCSVSARSYPWIVPYVVKQKNKCKVKVVLKDAGGIIVGSDVSDRFFTIQP